MPIDRHAFYDAIRHNPFPGKLAQAQVESINGILDQWERRGLTDDRYLAYMLGSTWHETAHTMQPIEEYGRGHGHPYGVPDPGTGKTYYGRGYIQLTWRKNYEHMAFITGVDLVNRPELALEPGVAASILIDGMTLGTFTGRKLSDYFNATKDMPVAARRIVNGQDRAKLIAGYHYDFLAALRA